MTQPTETDVQFLARCLCQLSPLGLSLEDSERLYALGSSRRALATERAPGVLVHWSDNSQSQKAPCGALKSLVGNQWSMFQEEVNCPECKAAAQEPSPIPEGAEEFVFDDGRRALLRVNDSGEVEAVMLDGDSFAETDGGVVVTELNIGLQNAMLSLRAKWATMQEPERVEVRGYQQGREYVLRMKRRDLELLNNLANGTDNALSVAVLNQLQQMTEGEGLVPSEDKPSTDGDALGEPYRVVGPMHFKREPKNDYPEDCQLEPGKILEFYTREQVEAERARHAEEVAQLRADAFRVAMAKKQMFDEKDARIAELEGALAEERRKAEQAQLDDDEARDLLRDCLDVLAKHGHPETTEYLVDIPKLTDALFLEKEARADKLAEELERVRRELLQWADDQDPPRSVHCPVRSIAASLTQPDQESET